MTYNELLKLYKAGELSDEERNKIETELEKFDAISAYLCDEADEMVLGAANCASDDKAGSQGKQSQDFANMINSTIRRIFIKTGITVGAVVLAVVLAVIFVLPGFVSGFYYNPNEAVGISVYDVPTTRMELDLSVYTELFMPFNYRDVVIADSDGYGEYTIAIPQSVSYTGYFNTVVGKLIRGKLTLYNQDILQPPAGNSFVMPEGIEWSYSGPGAAGYADEAFERLGELDEGEKYIAYFSLDSLFDYESFYNEFGSYSPWIAVYDGGAQGNTFGFLTQRSGHLLSYDEEKYPTLNQISNDGLADFSNEQAAKQHFISMLCYLRDNPDIAAMFENSLADWDEVIKYIEENGILTYGFAVVGDKETILEIAENEHVAYVYTSPLR